MKPTNKLLCILGICAAMFALIGLRLPQSEIKANPQRPTVQNVPADKALSVAGNVEALEQVDLYAGVPGFINKVNVDIGDRVKKGEVLAELSVPEMEAEYKQKVAVVEQAKAELDVTRRSVQAAQAAVDSVKLHVREAEAAVKSAQANLNWHKTQLERMKKLLENSSIDQAIFDEANQKAEAAKAAVDAAEARLLAVKASVTESQVNERRAEAMVKVAEARVAVAHADAQRSAVILQFARVTAPIDGIVIRRNVFAGDYAQAANTAKMQPLFVVARVDIVRMVIQVPENSIGQVTVDAPVAAHFAALQDREFKGKISRLGGAIDRNNGTLRAEIDLPNPEGKLLPGMFGTVKIGESRR
ncbi:MAG TPA: efflux RND transporter periplasmic adaptor subunit [Gemmataceae bacterium]|nr:efflux RND transporter periplasmic adaptor subunit [Gemmataceae bacterium]